MQDAAFAQRVSWAKSLARGRWKAILLAAGVSEELLAKQNKPCPACGGTDRFSFLDRDGDGTYFCRGCGGGDGFSLRARGSYKPWNSSNVFAALFRKRQNRVKKVRRLRPSLPSASDCAKSRVFGHKPSRFVRATPSGGISQGAGLIRRLPVLRFVVIPGLSITMSKALLSGSIRRCSLA